MKELINRIKYKESQRNKDDFNVFSMLQIENDEVRLHSRFLSFLFNHTSSHNCQNLFLFKFLKYINKTQVSFTVFPELILGQLGRADITFRNENQIIILENKVWSGLGHNQLERYSEYLNSQKQSEKCLVFLSPHKQEIRQNIDGVQIVELTYGEIANILISCLEEIKSTGLIEVLKQYIKICRDLSGETMENYSHQEIRDILREKRAFDVYKSIWQAGVQEAIDSLVDFFDVIQKSCTGSFISRTERVSTVNHLSLKGLKESLQKYPDEKFQGINIPIGKIYNNQDVHEFYIKIELNGRLYYVFIENINGKRNHPVSSIGNDLKSALHFKQDWIYPSKTINWRNLVDPNNSPDKYASLDIGYDFFDAKIRQSLADHMIEEILNFRNIVTSFIADKENTSQKTLQI